MEKRIIRYLFLGLFILSLNSCNDYFDVRPKSQVLAKHLFETEQGFEDQLIGVYKRLSSTSLYGQEMTFGFMEVLSQNYDLVTGNSYEEAGRYNYANTSMKSIIDQIWAEMYAAIANVNVMLQYFDDDLSIFSDNNHDHYKGEALGLRGFLHFELLRIFAPAYTLNPSALAIPYVTEYSPSVTPQSTVEEAINLVIRDLEEAEALLQPKEGVMTLTHSSYRLTYVSVNAILARAYQWKGDMENALRCARAVINDPFVVANYRWVDGSYLNSAEKVYWDRLFSMELLFRLNVLNMDENTNAYFRNTGDETQKLSPSPEKWNDIYEFTSGNGTDWRYSKHWEYDGNAPYFAKYWQCNGGQYNDQVPVIRKSEMYYIAAEALVSKDSIAQAVAYLNEVRTNRNISNPLQKNLSAADVQNEIYKEYRKEMVGEGQLFFYYKRMGYTSIPGSAVTASDNVYVLPMPDNEIEFGSRQ